MLGVWAPGLATTPGFEFTQSCGLGLGLNVLAKELSSNPGSRVWSEL